MPLFAVLFIGAMLILNGGIALMTWIRFRGTRVVICPETQEPAAVTVDIDHAAVTAVREDADLRLATCSRWPLPQECPQGCVRQIAIRGHDTRPAVLAAHLFANRRCAICGHPIDAVRAGHLEPGLLDSVRHEAKTWDEIPPEDLADAFQSHHALCANCTLAEMPSSSISGMLHASRLRR